MMLSTPSSSRSRSDRSSLDSDSWTPSQQRLLQRLDADERWSEERGAQRAARQMFTADGRLRKPNKHGSVHRPLKAGAGRVDLINLSEIRRDNVPPALKTFLTPAKEPASSVWLPTVDRNPVVERRRQLVERQMTRPIFDGGLKPLSQRVAIANQMRVDLR